MSGELIAKVWSNPRFHSLSAAVERAWLCKELGLEDAAIPEKDLLIRLSQAAAILAASSASEHRIAAYRAATFAYGLHGEGPPFDEVLRVVLARLGNFPAMQTRPPVEAAIARLPLQLAAEELFVAERRTIRVAGVPIRLTDFQDELWRRLTAHERIALSAPTSAGKSFILQAYLSSLFDKADLQQVVYLVPTRALITQVASDLGERFKGSKRAPEVITIPSEEGISVPGRAIHVLTQERCQLLLQANDKFYADLVIVDEAQSIEDGARGVLLHWVVDDLISRNLKTQVLFASPVVRNLDVFGRLFGLPDVKAFKSAEPAVSQNFILVDVVSARKGVVEISTLQSGQATSTALGRRTLDATLAGRKDRLVHIPLSMAGPGASLIYANGAAEAEDIGLQLSQVLKDRPTTSGREALAALAREVVHPSFVLAGCVKVGVGFHYSNIPAVLRLALENAFKSGEIDLLACTSTLLQGVNLPAKHVFMYAPEKGKRQPLQATDFWNLSGRAGRLRREFQGNIFLIDYGKWKSQPLSGAKDAEVRPAVEVAVSDRAQDLVSMIRKESTPEPGSKADDLESSFVRLFADFRGGTLERTLTRAGVPSNAPILREIQDALGEAAKEITLPSEVLKRSGNISAYKQQALFDVLYVEVEKGEEAAARLIPAHPREQDAYNSYRKILEICYTYIMGRDPSRRLQNFHALMAVRWMQGWSLPRIIQAQIDREKEKSVRAVIRDTLDIIEGQVRFEVARVFGCYNNLLIYAFNLKGFTDLASRVPGIPLFLEVGASDQSMISFMSLGLSRTTAMKLNDAVANKNMDTAEAKRWLQSQPLDTLDLSPLLRREVVSVLSSG